MAKYSVFIHTNPQQMVGAKIAQYALRKNSRRNDQFDVKILDLWDFPHLTEREGQKYLRKGTTVTWRNRDLQSFSPLRFLPPQLMNYQGRAVLIDPDIFALGDIYDLLARDMQGKAIYCRRGYPGASGDLTYNTSVMLMDCAKLKHWNWEQKIDAMFAGKFDYRNWIFLLDEEPATIGELEPEWNDWDNLTPKTKLLHNTERSTQPWKTGLPVDYNLNYQASGSGLRSLAKSLVRKGRSLLRLDPPQEVYQKHPDQRQERLFFTLMKECLDAGVFDETFLKEEMRQKHLRQDALKCAASI